MRGKNVGIVGRRVEDCIAERVNLLLVAALGIGGKEGVDYLVNVGLLCGLLAGVEVGKDSRSMAHHYGKVAAVGAHHCESLQSIVIAAVLELQEQWQGEVRLLARHLVNPLLVGRLALTNNLLYVAK